MKTVLALRHIHFEDLGTLEPLLQERGYHIRYLNPAEGGLADIDPLAFDLVIALGGPVGAFDDAAYPFLGAELQLIERRLASGKPMLGICLGAQLIARALGADVAPMGLKEIGFEAVSLTEDGFDSVLQPLQGVPVLHWHGDRFELPLGARLLAGTGRCDHQAYAVGNTVLGLQFHLEADAQRIEPWLVGHACELSQAGIDPRQLREAAQQHGAALAAAARQSMTRWLDGLQQSRRLRVP